MQNVERQVSFLAGRISHAYIVASNFADTLAMASVCSGIGGTLPCKKCPHCSKASRRIHPDITFLGRQQDKREIVVDQIRDLKKDVIVIPNESGKKAYIINDADLMNRNAQNAFLRILEEPPAHAVFILSTDNPSALLPTIRSRCVELKTRSAFENISEARTEDASDTSEMATMFFSAISQGNAQLMEFMFRLEKLDKEAFSGFLAASRVKAANLLRAHSHMDISAGNSRAATRSEVLAFAEQLIVKAGEMLDLNVSTGHISGMICASLINIESGETF